MPTPHPTAGIAAAGGPRRRLQALPLSAAVVAESVAGASAHFLPCPPAERARLLPRRRQHNAHRRLRGWRGIQRSRCSGNDHCGQRHRPNDTAVAAHDQLRGRGCHSMAAIVLEDVRRRGRLPLRPPPRPPLPLPLPLPLHEPFRTPFPARSA